MGLTSPGFDTVAASRLRTIALTFKLIRTSVWRQPGQKLITFCFFCLHALQAILALLAGRAGVDEGLIMRLVVLLEVSCIGRA